MIGTIEWKDVTGLSTEEFWVQVLQYKDVADEKVFEELAKFALAVMLLPFSNVAEKMFS